MSKNSLYLKKRPKQLNSLVGQPNFVATMKQASKYNRFAHAYLFSGTKGCGKTSSARILANLLNCSNVQDGKVCEECEACKLIPYGAATDVIELDGAKQRKVEDIANLIESASWSPQSFKKKVFIIDECLGRNSRIETEHGLIPVSTLVSQKVKIKVKSYNHELGIIEYKPITGWFKNSGKDVYKIHFESHGALYASANHLVSTPNGYRKVCDLKEGDLVERTGKKLSYEQEQLILGSLLGDANLVKNKPRPGKITKGLVNPRIRFRHGHKQLDYLSWKHCILSNLTNVSKPQLDKVLGYAKIPTSYFNTKADSAFNYIYDIAIKNGKKRVSREWLEKVDHMGLAIWFCDDGSLNRYETKHGEKYHMTLHTEGFTYSEHLTLKGWLLEKYNLNSTIVRVKEKYWILSLDVPSSHTMLDLIAPYVPSSMTYKLRGFDNGCVTDNSVGIKNVTIKEEIVYEKITKKEISGHEKVTYDIEVEDNHNYFVSGTLVHNCHQLSATAISSLLKIVEEPPEYLVFIFCTTEPDKIPDTILSRSQRHIFNKISSGEITGRLKIISDEEDIKCEEPALFAIAQMGRGSMRDAIGYLEQMFTVVGEGTITESLVCKYFGMADRKGVYDLVESMSKGDYSTVMERSNDMIVGSVNIRSLLYEISEVFRGILMIKVQGENTKLVDLPDHEILKLVKLSKAMGLSQLNALSKEFSTIEKELKYSINKRLVLESTLIRCTARLQPKK